MIILELILIVLFVGVLPLANGPLLPSGIVIWTLRVIPAVKEGCSINATTVIVLLLSSAIWTWHRVSLRPMLPLVVEVSLQFVLGHSVFDDGARRITSPARYRALHRSIIVQSLLDHANGLLLVTQSGKATEGHVVCPVEAAEVLRVLHPVRPVVLRFEVLGDLPALRFVFLLRLLILHQCAIKYVHLVSLLVLFRLHLFDELVQFLVAPLAYLEHLALARVLVVTAAVRSIVLVGHNGGRTNC